MLTTHRIGYFDFSPKVIILDRIYIFKENPVTFEDTDRQVFLIISFKPDNLYLDDSNYIALLESLHSSTDEFAILLRINYNRKIWKRIGNYVRTFGRYDKSNEEFTIWPKDYLLEHLNHKPNPPRKQIDLIRKETTVTKQEIQDIIEAIWKNNSWVDLREDFGYRYGGPGDKLKREFMESFLKEKKESEEG